MKSFILDTNVLVSYLTDRNLDQQILVSEYFKDASILKCELIIHDTVISEFIYVLKVIYNVDATIIAGKLKELIKSPGIKISNYIIYDDIFSCWPEKIRDFSDAVLAQYAKYANIPILTFDKKLIKSLMKENILVIKNL